MFTFLLEKGYKTFKVSGEIKTYLNPGNRWNICLDVVVSLADSREDTVYHFDLLVFEIYGAGITLQRSYVEYATSQHLKEEKDCYCALLRELVHHQLLNWTCWWRGSPCDDPVKFLPCLGHRQAVGASRYYYLSGAPLPSTFLPPKNW